MSDIWPLTGIHPFDGSCCTRPPSLELLLLLGEVVNLRRESAFAVAIGGKRTCPFALHMSANDPKRTLRQSDPFQPGSLNRYDILS